MLKINKQKSYTYYYVFLHKVFQVLPKITFWFGRFEFGCDPKKSSTLGVTVWNKEWVQDFKHRSPNFLRHLKGTTHDK